MVDCEVEHREERRNNFLGFIFEIEGGIFVNAQRQKYHAIFGKMLGGIIGTARKIKCKWLLW